MANVIEDVAALASMITAIATLIQAIIIMNGQQRSETQRESEKSERPNT